MLIVVTGGSGFVGRHLISALRRRRPEATVRSFDARPPDGEHPHGVETAVGSIEDEEAVHGAVAGADVVVHLAARVAPEAGDSEQLWRVNVEGTRNAYTSAVASRVGHFVHMSSAGVYGQPRRREPFGEDDAAEPVTPYQRSKWEAERAVRGLDAVGTTLNVMRPAGIYGPGSTLELPQYRRVRKQRWVVEVRGGVVVHPTYVDDVVGAILALLERPAPHGSVFNVGGERALQLQELEALQAHLLGVPRRRLVLPALLAGPVAAAAAPVLARRGRTNPLLAAMARGELFSAAVDDGRFRSSYPHVPVAPLERGLRETLAWAAERRLL